MSHPIVASTAIDYGFLLSVNVNNSVISAKLLWALKGNNAGFYFVEQMLNKYPKIWLTCEQHNKCWCQSIRGCTAFISSYSSKQWCWYIWAKYFISRLLRGIYWLFFFVEICNRVQELFNRLFLPDSDLELCCGIILMKLVYSNVSRVLVYLLSSGCVVRAPMC